MSINKLSGVTWTNISKVDGVTASGVSKVDGIEASSATVPESYEMWAGYSTRKLTSTATTCCRIERLNDNTTYDVGFDSNGDIDIAAAKTFAGSNPAKVVRWVDQSGNGRHLSEGSSADGPLLIDSSGNEVQLSSPVSKVGLHFSLTDNQPSPATDRMLEYTGAMNGGDWLLLTAVFQFTSTQGAQNIVSQDNSTTSQDVGEYLEQTSAKGSTRVRMAMNRTDGSLTGATNSVASAINTPYLATPHIYGGSSHEAVMNFNGTTTNGQGSSSLDIRTNAVLFRVGANAASSTTNQFKGIIGELVLYSSSNISDAPSSSGRDEIHDDANSYWGVYT